MWMKSEALRLCTLVLASLLAFAGCSGSQQDEEQLEVEDDEYSGNSEGDLGNDDAAEGNGQENFVEDNDAEYNQYQSEGQGQGQGYDSAEVNSAVEDLQTETVNATLDNTSAMNPAGAPAPAQANYAAAPAPAVPSDRAPIPGGRVRYVPEGGVEVVNAPGGTPVLTLMQGEHPVTWEENGWLRITNGMYVPMGALSDKGVGRPAYGKPWSTGGGY